MPLSPRPSIWRSLRVAVVIFLRPFGLTWLLDRTAMAYWRVKSWTRPRHDANQNHCVLVICAHFNHSNWLPGCVESVRNQTHPNWRMVIVDDASTEPVQHALEACAQSDDRIEVLQLNKNGGAYVARNAAIAHFQGEWSHVTFIDPDDVAEPTWLEHALSTLGDQAGWVRPLLREMDPELKEKKRLYFGHCQSLWSKEVWLALGWFQNVRIAGDTELLLRAKKLTSFFPFTEARATRLGQRCRVHHQNASRLKPIERKNWLLDRAEEISKAESPLELHVDRTLRPSE